MTYQCRSQPNQYQDESTPTEYIPKRTKEEKTTGVTSLHHSWDQRSSLIADMEVVRKDVENGVIVV